MDHKETNAPILSEAVPPDRSVILKLLDFLGQWPNPKPTLDKNAEQISPPTTLHPK